MAKWCASFREFSSMGSSLKELVLTRRPANWSRLDQRLKQFCCLSILELVPSQPYHIWNIHFCLVRPPRCCMSQCQWSTSTRSTRPLVGITSCTRARSTGGQFLLMASTSSCVDQIQLASFSLWSWIIIIIIWSPGSQAGRKSITSARSTLRATPIRNTGLWEGLPFSAISNKMIEKNESIMGNIYFNKITYYLFVL